MDENVCFLLDANAFITPYRRYYAFDLVPSFWDKIAPYLSSGTIVVLDLVRDELKRNDDALTKWMFSDRKIQIINHSYKASIEVYQQIMKYIVECGYYNNNGIRIWSEGTIADPWLIATAASKKCVLVTIEKQISALSKKNQTSKIKIPDVAKVFGVEVIDVFEMMRRLGIMI